MIVKYASILRKPSRFVSRYAITKSNSAAYKNKPSIATGTPPISEYLLKATVSHPLTIRQEGAELRKCITARYEATIKPAKLNKIAVGGSHLGMFGNCLAEELFKLFIISWIGNFVSI